MLLIIDNYDSFTCNIAILLKKLGQEVIIKKNDDITIDEISSISPKYIIIGPGPGSPKDANISIKAIRYFSLKIPILGICLGHQAIGEAFGLNIIRSKNPIHGKQELISNNNKGIFKGIKDNIKVVRYNSLTIEEIPRNSNLEVTATNQYGEIMGIRHKTLPIEGVQFHPESIFSDDGDKLFNNFLKISK